jgi:hypothetical protein
MRAKAGLLAIAVTLASSSGVTPLSGNRRVEPNVCHRLNTSNIVSATIPSDALIDLLSRMDKATSMTVTAAVVRQH